MNKDAYMRVNLKKLRTIFGVGLFLILSGCSYFDNYFSKESPQVETPKQSKKVIDQDNLIKYSDAPHMFTGSDRQYKRLTRSRLEDESELQSNAGSLWVMDGQQAYLFSQNKIRREGDVLNVKMDQAAMRQIETKVSVIKKLLKQLEEEELNKSNPTQNLSQETHQSQRGPASAATGNSQNSAVTPKNETNKIDEKKEDKQDLTELQTVQTRIVERTTDGNYKVKGAQPFMIGLREYRLIVSGIVRPEDYNDEGIQTSKLLEPQYDVVSVRKKLKDDRANSLTN